MIIFREPTSTTALILAATAAAASAGGAIATGVSQKRAADAAAADAELQAKLQQTEAARAIRDEREENKRQLARTRALLSGRGADLGTIISMTGAQSRESLIRQQRLSTGAQVADVTGRARASNLRQKGRMDLAGGLLEGSGSLLTGGAKLYQGTS